MTNIEKVYLTIMILQCVTVAANIVNLIATICQL